MHSSILYAPIYKYFTKISITINSKSFSLLIDRFLDRKSRINILHRISNYIEIYEYYEIHNCIPPVKCCLAAYNRLLRYENPNNFNYIMNPMELRNYKVPYIFNKKENLKENTLSNFVEVI